jgi:hypothetical protein
MWCCWHSSDIHCKCDVELQWYPCTISLFKSHLIILFAVHADKKPTLWLQSKGHVHMGVGHRCLATKVPQMLQTFDVHYG